MRHYVSPETLAVCEAWYMGQGSALYSILSLGYVVSEDIAERAYVELHRCLRRAKGEDAAALYFAMDEIEAIELTIAKG